MANLDERNERNRQVIEEFRSNGGLVGGNFSGRPLLLLRTKGARTGRTRVTPLMYLEDGERLLIFASKGGGPTSPDWFHNLTTHPDVVIEVGNEVFEATAYQIAGDERDALYAKQAELYPMFADYALRTTRVIPVVGIERISKI